jgi:N-methylhydantoinase A
MVPRGGLEIISLCVIGSAPTRKPTFVKQDYVGKDPSAALKKEREVYFGRKWQKTRIYDIARLQCGNAVEGLAILEGINTTVVIPPDRKVTIDEYMNMVMEER